MPSIAIFGFGRIGRSALRAALKDNLFTPRVIGDIKDLENLAALFKVDSNYGIWPEAVRVEGSSLVIGERKIQYVDVKSGLPDWNALGVDLVIECTGRATTRAAAQEHIQHGAKYVLISAAPKSLEDADAVLLPGINADGFDPDTQHIVSMASCTTNALASVVKVLRDAFGIREGFFATVHAYTNTQSLTDQPMKDRRDSWAAAENIIPSSSGAAKALKFIWPDLNVTGKAYRVPVRTGSIVELDANLNRDVTVEEVRQAFRDASAKAPLKGVMEVLEDEWASSRIVGDPHTSIIDLPLVQVLNGSLVSVAAWYDNEYGYATRLAEMAARMVYAVQAQTSKRQQAPAD
jgi:glyceraldehyde 3-phosphate dehydrogenase